MMSQKLKNIEVTKYTQGQSVAILLPLPFDNTFDYRVPPETDLFDGNFVKILFRKREIVGVVWGPGEYKVDQSKVRDVISAFDSPILPVISRRFIDWVSAYTLQSKGSVLKMTMSVPSAFERPRKTIAYTVASSQPSFKLTDARRRIFRVLEDGSPRTIKNIMQKASVGAKAIKTLHKIGAITPIPISRDGNGMQADPDFARVHFSPEQLNVVRKLVSAVKSAEFRVNVLDGVPGSGKTEVYFEVISEALRQNKQVLVLIPEIALSAQWLNRFKKRFGREPGVWHSDLTNSLRRRTWRKVVKGAIRVVVGARSALFLPYSNLGLIVVDEEHDGAFKQEEGVIYNARDMGIVRAKLGNIPIILASATPSLETIMNAQSGRYGSLHLPMRHGGASLPRIEPIDMAQSSPLRGKWLSPALNKELLATIERGEQVLLFLNRRGYAPLTLCRNCGYRLNCPHCTSWLVEHRQSLRLQCHQCGFNIQKPDKCVQCEANDSLVACGPGVERLLEEVKELNPNARTSVAASDNIDSPKAVRNLVYQIENHEIDVIIGTQIIAKGYHFPLLTLVGIVDADLGLQGGDLRAAERTFQLLYQVSGRAGRAQKPGRVVLQTYMKSHPVMATLLSGDRKKFLEAECLARKKAGMPPFGRLVALIVSGKTALEVERTARELGRMAPIKEGVKVFGPAPAPFALLRGRYRRRMLLKANREIYVQPIIQRWLSLVKIPTSVKVYVDVDPMSFL